MVIYSWLCSWTFSCQKTSIQRRQFKWWVLPPSSLLIWFFVRCLLICRIQKRYSSNSCYCWILWIIVSWGNQKKNLWSYHKVLFVEFNKFTKTKFKTFILLSTNDRSTFNSPWFDLSVSFWKWNLKWRSIQRVEAFN